ncbi:helicase [Lactobacillus delbrueckii subsp. bulgaricus]|nr:helicase [Lactobacillus delbrueckii subsp. bulgaricus]
MLPSILSKQLEKGLGDYIKTSFPMTNPPFKGSIEHMVEQTKGAVYHEPYVSVKLPFRISQSVPDYFDAIDMPFKPYVHQDKAFQRLVGDYVTSTLIATGTGSGKTECFLYPILEYCYKHRGERGIKALIIYPMNALATDQARRVAETIYNNEKLKGNITAGMFVGGVDYHASRGMSEHGIITDHETMLSNAPDILLTNYKMLDYLLARPKDASLWNDSHLRFIAVDELHTFDGAQGTDLACLIRRLKYRLKITSGDLCCIGTSATMGNKDSADSIRKFAENIFNEPFDTDSVITEDRLSADEYFANDEITDFAIPGLKQVKQLEFDVEAEDPELFLQDAVVSWITDFHLDPMTDEGRIELGKHLMHHSFFQSLVSLMEGKYCQDTHVISELGTRYPELIELGEHAPVAIDALYALVSHARTGSVGHLRPFLNVQVQVWLRELRRWVASVSQTQINYAIAHDLTKEQAKHYLPIINCRDCGATGWLSYPNEDKNVEIKDLAAVYSKFFEADEDTIIMYPDVNGQDVPNYCYKAAVCPDCMSFKEINDKSAKADAYKCDQCGQDMIPVIVPNFKNSSKLVFKAKARKQFSCPFCGNRRGVSIIGLRSATEISATLSQLFSSKFNDDKKTLAFSDNVQDAAHRAGFFNARTWRFGLRSAMQRYLNDSGKRQSLSEFTKGFIKYWQSKYSIEDYVAVFLAPNMTWMHPYEQMIRDRKLERNNDTQSMIDQLNQRLAYEFILEYGLASNLGRTLSKSNCSVLDFDAETIKQIAAKVKERTVNQVGVLRNTSEINFARMVYGFLNTLRQNGAFADSTFKSFVDNKFKPYVLSNDHTKWRPGLNAGRNVPSFLVSGKIPFNKWNSHYDTFRSNKYLSWIEACSDISDSLEANSQDAYPEIIKIILEETVKSGIVEQFYSSDGLDVYGLNKGNIYLSTDVKQLRCATCGSTYAISADDCPIMEHASCLRNNCTGELEVEDNLGLDYYGKLYSQGDLVRVNAREHTGLLDGNDRTALENNFKLDDQDRHEWDTNVLSCTPTLEMGIDIGDLSTVILCNMPPGKAQFLQRLGRAGRKDGNALTIIVANAKAHDLYFYADPNEMLGGDIRPPKIFLNASAVLERQLVAFCLDNWVAESVNLHQSDNLIPSRIRDSLIAVKNNNESFFPYTFLKNISISISNRLNSFFVMFGGAGDALEESTKEELRIFAKGRGTEQSPMNVRILQAFIDLNSQIASIDSKIKDLEDLIKEVQQKPQDSTIDEQINELRKEESAQKAVKKDILEKDTFNFLSDEGLIPNYAFPEEGITLKSIIFRKKTTEELADSHRKDGTYLSTTYEYKRSASAAIREFAPDNTFYAGGHKMKIDQIDINSTKPEKWRLCPDCSYAQLEDANHDQAECPRCHSVAWADAGQVRTMLKVQMVYSTMDVSKAMIADDSDDRSTTFYNDQLLVDVDEDHDLVKAYEMDNDSFPFGFEYVKKAKLREINYGETELVGSKLKVSGRESIAQGFKVCQYCGKLITSSDSKTYNPKDHSRYCKTRQMSLLEQNEAVEECLFLFREFETEALRILIPVTAMDAVNTESFVAAFMLGMSEHFGNIDHLRTTISQVPVLDSDQYKQYLVIYDSVPGGTGYLKQFINQDDKEQENLMIQILEAAVRAMESCQCVNDPNKDGCYHCVFAYRNVDSMGNVSRSSALGIVKKILEGKNSLKETRALNDINTNKLFDSELERNFIEALKQSSHAQRPISVTAAIVNGKEGYNLNIRGASWQVEQQVDLGPEDGVAVKCRPDFVFWPVRSNKLPVAIFTDGFKYHKDKVADDTLKREAIRRSKNFLVWSLTSKDVYDIFINQGDYYTKDILNPDEMPTGKMYQQMTVGNSLIPLKMKPFELLLKYLELPDAMQQFKQQAKAFSLALLDTNKIKDSLAFTNWNKVFRAINEETNFTKGKYPAGETLFGSWSALSKHSQINVYAGKSMNDINNTKCADVAIVVQDDPDSRGDKYQEELNAFWKFANIMQFLPKFIAVSETGLKNNVYLDLKTASEIEKVSPLAVQTTPINQEDSAWNEVMDELEISDSDAQEFARKVRESGIIAPNEISYEVEGNKGAVLATIEIAWTSLKIGYLTEDQLEDKIKLEEDGWKLYDADNSEFDKSLWGGNR